MPRIDAPTVAEHHRRRRAALLAAAAEVLADAGPQGLTLAAVGAAAGLARTSVYQYFESAPALLAAVVEDAFGRSTVRLAAAVASAGDPVRQVDAYLRCSLELIDEPAFRALHALGGASLPAECAERLTALHRLQQAPLQEAVAALGVADPELVAGLVQGLIAAAARAVLAGAPSAQVLPATLAVLRHGLPGLRDGG